MADWLLADELPGTQGHNEPFNTHPPLLTPPSPPALISQTETVTLCMKKGGCDERRQIAPKQTCCFANGRSYDT